VRAALEDYTYSGLHHSSQRHPACVLQPGLVANFLASVYSPECLEGVFFQVRIRHYP